MASRASVSNDLRVMKKPLTKSLLLKDYLLDDLSSCSSNGFRSYPRRQCCTTVRFLVETDLHKHGKLKPKQQPQPFRKSKSEARLRRLSVLQRASSAMINAFKHFPFAGAGNPRFLPTSLSRKLLKHGFWKRPDRHNKEIKRLKSFADLIKEEQIPPSTPPEFSAVVTTATAELNGSTSNSYSWSDSDFTAGNCSDYTSTQNGVIGDFPVNKKTTNEERVSVTTGTGANYSATTGNSKKKWQNEENEQFSPVSVMDFPYHNDNENDDEDEVSSACSVKETNQKPVHKNQRFEGVAHIEPIRLEDRIAHSVHEPPSQTHLTFSQQENQIEQKAMTLFRQMKTTIAPHNLLKFEAIECLLLGFFKEGVTEKKIFDYEMLQVAKDWVNGQPMEMFLDWESYKTREKYISEMEKPMKWSKYDELEKREVGLELEYDIFISLVDESLQDFYL